MAPSIDPRLDAIPRKSLAMRGESLRKKLADPATVRLVGHVIEDALRHAGLTQKEAADRLGYDDQSAISRWISGVEPPQLVRLLAHPSIRAGLVIALAEHCGSDVEVRTVVTLRKAVGA